MIYPKKIWHYIVQCLKVRDLKWALTAIEAVFVGLQIHWVLSPSIINDRYIHCKYRHIMSYHVISTHQFSEWMLSIETNPLHHLQAYPIRYVG